MHASVSLGNSKSSPCRYCSVVSKANGVSPIGTAIVADLWIMIEVPHPWAQDPWQEESASLLDLFQSLERRPRLWQRVRILAIALDRDYSQPGYRHVMSYRRPSPLFARYHPEHYCVPTATVTQLVKAMVFQLPMVTFATYRQKPVRSLFVCTHTHYDVACGRFGTPLFKTLKRDYAADGKLRIWQTSHFGGHHFAPTLIDFPQGQFWGHLESEILDILIYRRGDWQQLYRFYRGWGGVSPWAQIVERELWMQKGWSWLELPKADRMQAQDPGKLHHRMLQWLLRWVPLVSAQVLLHKLEQKLTWAKVEIRAGNGSSPGGVTHTARVEANYTALAQFSSGDEARLSPIKQYRVVSLKQS